MNPAADSGFSFADATTVFGNALLNAPALRAWPPALAAAREILAGQAYEVIERIGYGGMGAVFKVRNLEPGLDRFEAVKIRRPEARDDASFRERFLREIATLAQLRHPGLTTVFRSGESAEGYLWFSMEYLDGNSLAELTGPRQPPLAPERVLDITRQLCATLQFIHTKGRLHRDLKPANVMVCEDGSVRLLDFGIASVRVANPGSGLPAEVTGGSRHLTQPGESPHTPDFAAPEQTNGGPVDERTDLYGFGRIVNAMIRPPGSVAPVQPSQFPQRLLELVDDLLAFDQRDRPDSAAAVAEKLGQLEPGSPGFWGRDRCPFRGLEAYQPEHAGIFFGREAAIRRGREILQIHDAAAWNGFLLITGASGSGKSSLARAGLGPALLGGAGAGLSGRRLLVCDLATLRPEHGCLLSPLGRVLAAGFPETPPTAIMAALRDSNTDLGLVFNLPSGEAGAVACCLILDQFEHLFRMNLPRGAQARLLTVIARLAGTPGLVVLATLRSDCYHQCEGQPLLMELKDGRQLDIASPQSWEIAAMLRLSARAAALTFETGPDGRGLDDVLLEHARRNPQALPLLSYVLDQLWEHRDQPTNTLRFADFEALGGFEGAIAEKARTTFNAFAEDYPIEAGTALDDLLHLVVEAGEFSHSAAATFVRRWATPAEIGAATPAVQQLAERLVAARLLVQDASGVAFAHDALLSEAVVGRWEALARWLDESASLLRTRTRIAARMREGSPLLEGDPLLETAKAHLALQADVFAAGQRDFIEAATAVAEEKSRRTTRRRRLALVALSALSIAAIAGALFGLNSARQATAQRDEARHNEGLGWMLRAQVAEERHQQYPDTLLHAAHAMGYEGFGRPPKAPDTLLTFLRKDTHPADYERARQWIASRPAYLPLWISPPHPAPVTALAVSPDDRQLAVAHGDGTLRLWDFSAPGDPVTLTSVGALGLSFHPADGRLAIATATGIKGLDPEQRALVSLAEGPSSFIQHRPDGQLLAAHGNALDFHGAANPPARLSCMLNGPLHSLARCADDAVGAVAAADGVRVFFPRYAAMAYGWLENQTPGTSIALSPDGRRLAVGQADGGVSLWDIASAGILGQCSAEEHHDGEVRALCFHPDGSRLATASADGTLRLWDVSTHSPRIIATLRGHRGPVTQVAYLGGGGTLASASADGTARLWEVSGKPLPSPDLFSYHARNWYAFDPARQDLLGAGGHGFAAGMKAAHPAGWSSQGGTGHQTETVATPPELPSPKEGAGFSNSVEVALVWCEPTGETGYLMGSPEAEPGRYFHEIRHPVVLSRGFWIGKHEVTQRQWLAVVGNNPSNHLGSGLNSPVENVSWAEAMRYCHLLTDRERLRGTMGVDWEYSLPTEAQWEYACRAGSGSAFYFGDDPSVLFQYGNFNDRSGNFDRADLTQNDGHQFTAPVGSYLPNAWGLYDMAGNVWEWCRDALDPANPAYPLAKAVDPLCTTGATRVYRGGCWSYPARYARSASRFNLEPANKKDCLGFRVVLIPRVSSSSPTP